MLFSPLPHGIAGPWDEVLVLSILLGYGVLVLLGSLRRRKRQHASAAPPDWLFPSEQEVDASESSRPVPDPDESP